MQDPGEGAPAQQRTRFRALFDQLEQRQRNLFDQRLGLLAAQRPLGDDVGQIEIVTQPLDDPLTVEIGPRDLACIAQVSDDVENP